MMVARVWPSTDRVSLQPGGWVVWQVELEPLVESSRARAQVHAAARETVASCMDIDAKHLYLRHRPGRSPETGIPGLTLSLSYAGRLALIAIARGRSIGIDVVRVDEVADHLMVAARYLDPTTAASIVSAPPELQAVRFAAAWAEMEARSKCVGRGVSEYRSLEPDGCLMQEVGVPTGWIARLALSPADQNRPA